MHVVVCFVFLSLWHSIIEQLPHHQYLQQFILIYKCLLHFSWLINQKKKHMKRDKSKRTKAKPQRHLFRIDSCWHKSINNNCLTFHMCQSQNIFQRLSIFYHYPKKSNFTSTNNFNAFTLEVAHMKTCLFLFTDNLNAKAISIYWHLKVVL